MRNSIVAPVLVLAAMVLFYVACVHYTDNYEVGLRRNIVTGELALDSHKGLNFSAPWTQVARIDTRPHRVCITSSGHAVFNCKLVEFNPAAYQEFVKIEGFRYYWWSNRISFNMGYRREYRGMLDVLRGYAFSSTQYPFIRVIEETAATP